MPTLEQFRSGLNRAWESVAEGWRQLQQRAAEAVTRFQPLGRGGGVQTPEEQVVANASRWGLLAAEVKEGEDTVTVRLEVPGMERDDFDLAVVEGRLLTIRGEKHAAREQTQGRYHVMERAYGAFERTLALPAEVDETGAKAGYRRGVLTVELPKHKQAARRRIEVKAE